MSEDITFAMSDFKINSNEDSAFIAAWEKMKELGFQYSEENIEKVHLGWLLANRVSTQQPVPNSTLLREMLRRFGDQDGCISRDIERLESREEERNKPLWPLDIELPNGGSLVMEGNLTSDKNPFSVIVLKPDKTVLWEKVHPTFEAAKQHFDKCIASNV